MWERYLDPAKVKARPKLEEMTMKISFVLGAAAGYVLGARAGRERYETIVRLSRKVVGSQTIQSSAGVLQAQVDGARARAWQLVSDRLHPRSGPVSSGVNGHRS